MRWYTQSNGPVTSHILVNTLKDSIRRRSAFSVRSLTSDWPHPDQKSGRVGRSTDVCLATWFNLAVWSVYHDLDKLLRIGSPDQTWSLQLILTSAVFPLRVDPWMSTLLYHRFGRIRTYKLHQSWCVFNQGRKCSESQTLTMHQIQ